MDKARTTKAEQYLSTKRIRYNGNVLGIKEYIETIIDEGYTEATVADVPKYAILTNTQWNRMYADEQEHHMKREKETKKEYRLGNGNAIHILRKTEYDYALTILKNKK